MTPELHQKIHAKLAPLLKREPTEDEITNAQNDYLVLAQINADDIASLQEQLTTVRTHVALLSNVPIK